MKCKLTAAFCSNLDLHLERNEETNNSNIAVTNVTLLVESKNHNNDLLYPGSEVDGSPSRSFLGGGKFAVSFPMELTDIVAEARHLDIMKFRIPEETRDVAILEEGYRNSVLALATMLDRHAALLGLLTTQEVRKR